MRYLLIGNPNVGKSSLFNELTDTYAHVGNYGGITVEQKVGHFKDCELIDLPGTYSVIPNSDDEGVVTQTLLNSSFDGIINIVDATHLKRNLHLSIQLLELGVPMRIVLNMIDELANSGKTIHIETVETKLKCPIFKVSAKTKSGIDDLKEDLLLVHEGKPIHLYYGKTIESAILRIQGMIPENFIKKSRWLAIQLLEGNKGVYSIVKDPKAIEAIVLETEQEIIKQQVALSLKGAIFNVRRNYIDQLLKDSLETVNPSNSAKILNHKIDFYLTHPFYGLVIFLLIMFSIYFFTFDFIGTIISNLIANFISQQFSPFMSQLLIHLGVHSDSLFMSLIVDGVIAGVGGVIVFVPQIAILFFMLAFLEGTGYMARLAMMLDTLLSKFGLNGKSIVPLVTGIGCNVPAIMATRTISDKKERLLTILIIPFMSCSARIPIYALLASLFFPKYKALVIISMYLIGTMVALISAKLLSLSLFKNKSQFVIEIPPYRMPSGKNVFRYTKLMLSDFIGKAGKFILLGTIILWLFQYMGPHGVALTQDTSFLGYLGNFFAPIFKPLGFGSWQATSSLMVGFLAKELILSSMIVIYGTHAAIGLTFTGLSAFSFMVFSLLYLPCLATVGTIYQETKSYKFVLFALGFTFSIAYVVSALVYQIGSIFV